MADICFKVIDFGSKEYESLLGLRDLILRRPLGLVLSEEDTRGEESQIHIAGFQKNELICGLIFAPREIGVWQMRQVCVKNDLQRSGAGTLMVRFAEDYARQNAVHKIILHSRKASMDFYLKNGYEACGSEYIEIGIPHFTLEKEI